MPSDMGVGDGRRNFQAERLQREVDKLKEKIRELVAERDDAREEIRRLNDQLMAATWFGRKE